jgi:phosphatidylserine/phosphatidylglycerophosphate/cardiolipin synthase-like enzyme
MKAAWINVIAPKKPYIHAKSFIVDNDILYIWSINFSNNSMGNMGDFQE